MALALNSLQQRYSHYTPEWAYPETGIEPELIRKTAAGNGMYKPALWFIRATYNMVWR